jgi:uncharacterized membrane protein YdbT with pleckstrin-like domain
VSGDPREDRDDQDEPPGGDGRAVPVVAPVAVDAARRADAGGGPGWPLEPGERVLLERRPDPTDVPLTALGFAVVAVVIAVPFWGLAGLPRMTIGRGTVLGVFVLLIAGRLVWGEIERRCRRFVLTDRRVLARFGVFRRHLTVLPLARVQHTVLARRFRDRLTGIGTVGIATAGTGSIEMAWIGVRDPEAVLARIESAAATAAAAGTAGTTGTADRSV